MMRTYIFILFLGLAILSACENKAPHESTTEEASSVEETQGTQAVVATIDESIQAAPTVILNSLKAKVNGVEATMYTSGASFSVFEAGSVAAFLTLIESTPPKSLTKNQVGHIMLLNSGEMVMLCKVYNNGTDVYMEIESNDESGSYYNTLAGQAQKMFTDIQLQTK